MGDDIWRVDVEIARDPDTAASRAPSTARVRTPRSPSPRLKVADHEKRLPTGGTNARSVAAAFQLYRQTIDAGLTELAPTTVLTVRSTAKIMLAVELPDGRRFGDIRLSRLNWHDIEYLYATRRGSGKSAAYIRRCATVLARPDRHEPGQRRHPAPDDAASPTPRREKRFERSG